MRVVGDAVQLSTKELWRIKHAGGGDRSSSPRGLPGRVGGAAVGGPGLPGRHLVAVLDEGALGGDGEGAQAVQLVGAEARVVAHRVRRQALVATAALVVGNYVRTKKTTCCTARWVYHQLGT